MYTDLILIREHTYECNTFSDVDYEAFSKSAYICTFVVFTISIKACFERGWRPLLSNDLDSI